MSQRLHIGKTGKDIYDCVIDNADNVEKKVKYDWLKYDDYDKCFWGPFKISISDIELWYSVEPMIHKTLASMGVDYPSDIWMFYCNGKVIEHPSPDELNKWIKEASVEKETVDDMSNDK